MEQIFKGKKALVILTNTEEMQPHSNKKTGFDIKCLAYLYCMIREKNERVEFVFCTPKGGEAPIDPETREKEAKDPMVRKFLEDHTAMEHLKNTKKFEQLSHENFGGVFIPGGPGCVFDLPDTLMRNPDVIFRVYENKGIIATIGHGLAGLINLPKSRHGTNEDQTSEYWIKGRKVTGFSKEEDKKQGLDRSLPFVLEDKASQRGARFEHRDPFSSFTLADERLVTGQNPESAKDWVTKIIETCKEHQ